MDASILSLRERALHGTTALLSGLGIGLLLKQLASLILPESFISDVVTYALIIASVFLVHRSVTGIGSEQKRQVYSTLAFCIRPHGLKPPLLSLLIS